MNCPKCNTPNPDGQKFCGNCGTELPNEEKVSSPSNDNTFSYQDNKQSPQPKKKKHGCLIAIIVVVVLFIGIGILFGSGNSNDSGNSESGNKKETTESEKKEYVDDIEAVASNPDDYKGKYIKFYGLVSSIDKDDEKYGYQVYIDLDYNNSVLLEVPKKFVKDKINEDDYISVDAKIDGSYDGQTVMGVDSSWAYLEANSIEKTSYTESFGKANKTWEFTDKVSEQNGISVSVTKVEFAEEETRVYVTATNNSSDKFSLWSSSAIAIQNDQQYDQTYGNAYEQYEELSSDILPGASTSGVICFGKLDPAQFKLHMEGSSDNYDIDFAPFELDLAQ